MVERGCRLRCREHCSGGFQNHWPSEEPVYNISDDIYPRYRQYYLSLDIDLSKIPVKRKGWRTLLDLLNVTQGTCTCFRVQSYSWI